MCATRSILLLYSFGEMITVTTHTGTSVKDFVFRNFWERDECHGLLEKLRVEAQEAENMLEEAAAAEGEVGDDGDEVEGDDDSSSHDNVSIREFLFCFLWFSMVCGVHGCFVFNHTYDCIDRNSSLVGIALGIFCFKATLKNLKCDLGGGYESWYGEATCPM